MKSLFILTKLFLFCPKCPKKEFLLRVSYMEIYNETVTDLLVDSWKRKPLEVRETINVSGLFWHFRFDGVFADLFRLVLMYFSAYFDCVLTITVQKNIYVADLTEELVTNPEQALAWIRKGESKIWWYYLTVVPSQYALLQPICFLPNLPL